MSSYPNIHNSAKHQHNKQVLSADELMAYREGTLSPEQTRKIEEIISDESPESDAIEGLQLLQAADTKKSIATLQHKLHSEILRNKSKRSRSVHNEFWTWMAIIIILLLIVVGYIVVRIASK